MFIKTKHIYNLGVENKYISTQARCFECHGVKSRRNWRTEGRGGGINVYLWDWNIVEIPKTPNVGTHVQ